MRRIPNNQDSQRCIASNQIAISRQWRESWLVGDPNRFAVELESRPLERFALRLQYSGDSLSVLMCLGLTLNALAANWHIWSLHYGNYDIYRIW